MDPEFDFLSFRVVGERVHTKSIAELRKPELVNFRGK